MKTIVYYTIYETVNKINGKKYIGKHITNNIQDNYLGSGLYLTKAIKKYGRENFIKNILFIFDNEIDMTNKEKELVNTLLISDDNYYNIALGGQGGVTVLYKEHPLYELVCDKLKHTQKKRANESSKITKELHKKKKVGMYGKKQTENQKKIVSEFMTGRKKTQQHIQNHKKSLEMKFSDPNYIHPNKGVMKIKKQCTHCNRDIDSGNYSRYHGDKCKLNPLINQT